MLIEQTPPSQTIDVAREQSDRLKQQLDRATREKEQAEEEVDRAKTLLMFEAELSVFIGSNKNDEDYNKAKEDLREALSVLDEKTQAYDRTLRAYLSATVDARVEGIKLSFEVYKLRATLCGASLVGIAAVSGLVFPTDLNFVSILVPAFIVLLLSMVLSLHIMDQLTKHVEQVLVSAAETGKETKLAFVARWSFTVGIVLFVVFTLLNLVV